MPRPGDCYRDKDYPDEIITLLERSDENHWKTRRNGKPSWEVCDRALKQFYESIAPPQPSDDITLHLTRAEAANLLTAYYDGEPDAIDAAESVMRQIQEALDA